MFSIQTLLRTLITLLKPYSLKLRESIVYLSSSSPFTPSLQVYDLNMKMLVNALEPDSNSVIFALTGTTGIFLLSHGRRN